MFAIAFSDELIDASPNCLQRSPQQLFADNQRRGQPHKRIGMEGPP